MKVFIAVLAMVNIIGIHVMSCPTGGNMTLQNQDMPNNTNTTTSHEGIVATTSTTQLPTELPVVTPMPLIITTVVTPMTSVVTSMPSVTLSPSTPGEKDTTMTTSRVPISEETTPLTTTPLTTSESHNMPHHEGMQQPESHQATQESAHAPPQQGFELDTNALIKDALGGDIAGLL